MITSYKRCSVVMFPVGEGTTEDGVQMWFDLMNGRYCY